MRLRDVLTFCILIAAPCVLTERCSGQDENREAEGKAAVTAFAANMASFPHFTCRYKETRAEAANLQDALSGKWRNAISTEFRVAVDGENELNECLAPPPPPPKLDRERRSSAKSGAVQGPPVVFSGEGYLTNGDHEMAYWSGLKAINLYRKSTPFHAKMPRMPLRAALLQRDQDTPDQILEKPEEWKPTFLGRTVINGMPAIGVQFDGRNGEHMFGSVQYFFNPAQGYLILHKKRTYSAKSSMPRSSNEQVFLLEGRECSRQRWFPERAIVLLPTEQGKFMVREIKVLELEVDKKPLSVDFTLTVPVGTQVLDYHDFSKGTFELKQEERISLENLPDLFEMLDKVKSNPRMDTGIPERRSRDWLRWLGIASGVLLVAAGVFLILRRRKAQHATRNVDQS